RRWFCPRIVRRGKPLASSSCGERPLLAMMLPLGFLPVLGRPAARPRQATHRKDRILMYTLKRSVRQTTALLLAVVFLLSSSLRADEATAKKASRAHIVIVGVNDYADKQIKPRKHAETDARALYDLFTSKDYLGADAKNVRLLLGSEDKARDSKTASRA